MKARMFTHATLAVLLACAAACIAEMQYLEFDDREKGEVITELEVNGKRVGISGYGGSSQRRVIVFDSDNPTPPSQDPAGMGDLDLGTPNNSFGGPGIGDGGRMGQPYENDSALHNLLIVSQQTPGSNGKVWNPNDMSWGDPYLDLDFSEFDSITVHSLVMIDVDSLVACIELYDKHGALLRTTSVPAMGDNGVADVDLSSTRGVGLVRVKFNGSGAIDNIGFTIDRPPPAVSGKFR